MNTHCIARAARQRIIIAGFAALLVIALGGLTSAVVADEYSNAAVSTPWVVIPGGIADTAGKIAYVSSMNDGVEAVDLESGQAIWESKEALHPLALDGDQLLAQAPRGQGQINTMDIVVLDAPSGKLIKHTQPIVLPDWIAVDGGIGLSFNSVAAIDGHEMVLTWRAERQFAKGVTFANGVPPTQEAIAAARKIESGQARVDVESGTATVAVDRVPQAIRIPRPLAYYDVGDKRISLVESPENVAGGIRIVHCLLDARSVQSGRPMWKHEIAGEIILPDVPPTAQRVQGGGDQQPRR
ncbi:MAG TPA: hypothetical protein VMJ32_16540 [Pirellulales bacterium]|nr:hypothetical protein [Pirellulales bacterium]